MTTTTRNNRAALYTRFSSNLQKKTSTEGQIIIGRQTAKRLDLDIVEIYSDEAKSGQKERFREAYQRMLADARARKFDYIIVEQWSRLTRGTSAITRLWQQLDYNNIKMVDQSGVPMTETMASVAALYNSIFRPQLADFVRRGHRTAVENGKFPGTPPYGYRAIEGKPGYIEVYDREAEIIIRIFKEYAAGRSTRDICRDLTAEGVPTPGSRKSSGSTAWNYNTLVSGRNGGGILGNRLYVGELHWLTRTTVINPDTELDERRKTPVEQHAVKRDEAWRIIPPDLWDAVQAMRSKRATHKFGPSGKPQRRTEVIARNADHPLSGALRCACCKGSMRIAQTSRDGSPRAACANAHQRLTCDHTRSFDMDTLLTDVREYIDQKLSTPELVRVAFEAFKERRKESKKKDSERSRLQLAIATLTTDIERLSAAIASTRRKPEELFKLIDAKDAEREAFQRKLDFLGGDEDDGNVIAFRPLEFADVFSGECRRLVTALQTDPRGIETRLAFKALVGTILVHPSPKRMPYRIEVLVNRAAFGMRLFPEKSRRKPAEIAASACYNIAQTGKSVSS